MKHDISQTIFNCPCRLSISTFLQNILPNLVIINLWLTEWFFEKRYSNNSMKNDRTKTIFTSTWTMSISNCSAIFQPNPLFFFFTTNGHRKCGGRTKNEQTTNKINKQTKIVCKPAGDPVEGRDAPGDAPISTPSFSRVFHKNTCTPYFLFSKYLWDF